MIKKFYNVDANTTRFLLSEWDDHEARYFYKLMEATSKDGYNHSTIASGDYIWAKRTAEHYNIEMPKEGIM